MKEAQEISPEILHNSRALAALWQGIRDEDRYKLHPFPAERKLLNLVQCDRALTEMKHDVKQASEVMAEVLDDNQGLAAICPSRKNAGKALQVGRQAPSMHLGAALPGEPLLHAIRMLTYQCSVQGSDRDTA